MLAELIKWLTVLGVYPPGGGSGSTSQYSLSGPYATATYGTGPYPALAHSSVSPVSIYGDGILLRVAAANGTTAPTLTAGEAAAYTNILFGYFY